MSQKQPVYAKKASKRDGGGIRAAMRAAEARADASPPLSSSSSSSSSSSFSSASSASALVAQAEAYVDALQPRAAALLYEEALATRPDDVQLLDALGELLYELGDADEAIIGGANGIQGPGTFTVDPGTFSLQTHVVPEPGSALLILAAAATHLIRRARRLTRMSMP